MLGQTSMPRRTLGSTDLLAKLHWNLLEGNGNKSIASPAPGKQIHAAWVHQPPVSLYEEMHRNNII